MHIISETTSIEFTSSISMKGILNSRETKHVYHTVTMYTFANYLEIVFSVVVFFCYSALQLMIAYNYIFFECSSLLKV